jgi:hypothetical protein
VEQMLMLLIKDKGCYTLEDKFNTCLTRIISLITEYFISAYISGTFKMFEKVNIDDQKANIGNKKVNIEDAF